MSETPDAFFVREGERYAPTGLGVSFWNPKAQGGAVISGLAAHLLDQTPCPGPMFVSRLTIDIYGAAPMTALEPSLRVLRDGKRIQLVGLELNAEGRTWARATMLRVRESGPTLHKVPLTHPFPDESQERQVGRMTEMIRRHGDARRPGPGAMWVRVITPMVANEPSSPLACVAAAADMGTTVAPPASAQEWTFANLDVSLHLSRRPVGEWLLLDGVNEVAGNGGGQVHLRLGDRDGMFGMAHQSLYLDRRPEAP